MGQLLNALFVLKSRDHSKLHVASSLQQNALAACKTLGSSQLELQRRQGNRCYCAKRIDNKASRE